MMFTRSKQHGFTLIEMIVSLGVFSIVVLAAVGALLMLIGTNRQLQGEQSVMTNLSFALDSMTREIRTGTHYFCDSRPNTSASHPGGQSNMFNPENDLDQALGDTTLDCANPSNQPLRGLAFKEGGDSITAGDERILYYFDENEGKIYRRIGSEQPESVTSSGLYIRDFQFFVTGSAPLSDGAGERDQASVTIFVEASDVNDPSAKSYYMQTTVTQRTLDI